MRASFVMGREEADVRIGRPTVDGLKLFIHQCRGKADLQEIEALENRGAARL
jgi:hypothetical protein